MSKTKYQVPQQPLILRYHRLMDAFSKSDDERDFFLDKIEGFLVYADLDKTQEEIEALDKEIFGNPDRYEIIPKLTYYETKKFMEGFVNEKVYDIDTKEKLLDIISAKESRENFIEFIYDHLTELDKWQQYYHERSRIRIIEWLRKVDIKFVFEEDMELTTPLMEKLKVSLFEEKVGKEIQSARNMLEAKAKTYYSNEALNPRPKRGRPPKQIAKVEVEPQLTRDIYTLVHASLRPFLFMPEYTTSSATFSSRFESEEQLLASLRGSSREKIDTKLELLSQRLESLRHLSGRLSSFDITDLDKEQAIFKEISAGLGMKASIKPIEPTHDRKPVSQIAKEILPKKRGRPRKDSPEMQEFLEQKKKTRVKKVTPIKYGGKK